MTRLAWVLLLLPLGGCVTALQNRFYADYAATPLNQDAVVKYSKLVKALEDSSNDGFAVSRQCFNTKPASMDPDLCQAQRNEVVAALVIGSDELCVTHRKTIYGNEAAWNVGLGTMTSLFAGAASVVHTETAKSILAALALFSNSERSLVNETIYKQMLVTAVDKKIVETRDTKADAIYVSLKQPITTYSMHDALRDVITFHNTCSFMSGLLKALEEGTQGTTAQRIVRLRANLASIGAEIEAIGTTERTGALKDKYDQLAARYKAVAETLKTLETS